VLRQHTGWKESFSLPKNQSPRKTTKEPSVPFGRHAEAAAASLGGLGALCGEN
jgi:hypothetical protein